MLARRMVLVCTLVSAISWSAIPVYAAIPYASGTYTTPNRSGSIAFTPIKRVIQFGYQGTVKIDGKSYPGVLYFPRTGGVGLAWYYGTSGNTLGTPQADGSFSGPVLFFDRNGNTIDSGTANFR